MSNNELQLTDLEQQVLEAFCELYCDFVINKGDPVPRRHIKGRCNFSNYKLLKALKSLREKGLIKLVREYYEGDLEEESFMMIGYRPTDELEATELYKTIEKEVEEEIKEHFKLY